MHQYLLTFFIPHQAILDNKLPAFCGSVSRFDHPNNGSIDLKINPVLFLAVPHRTAKFLQNNQNPMKELEYVVNTRLNEDFGPYLSSTPKDTIGSIMLKAQFLMVIHQLVEFQ